MHARDPKLANVLLDGALQNETLAPWYPVLQTAVGIDKDGVNRLMHSLALGKAPIWIYRNLASGRATDPVSGQDLNELVVEIAAKPGGYDVAIEILWMRLHSDTERKQDHGPEIIDAGCELMRQLRFTKKKEREGYRLEELSKRCLVGEKGATIVQEICRKAEGLGADIRNLRIQS